MTTVATLLLVAWLTDFVDGPLARSSGLADRTWIGRQYLHIDIITGLALLTYLRLAGYVSNYLAIGYVAAWALIYALQPHPLAPSP